MLQGSKPAQHAGKTACVLLFSFPVHYSFAPLKIFLHALLCVDSRINFHAWVYGFLQRVPGCLVWEIWVSVYCISAFTPGKTCGCTSGWVCSKANRATHIILFVSSTITIYKAKKMGSIHSFSIEVNCDFTCRLLWEVFWCTNTTLSLGVRCLMSGFLLRHLCNVPLYGITGLMKGVDMSGIHFTG